MARAVATRRAEDEPWDGTLAASDGRFFRRIFSPFAAATRVVAAVAADGPRDPREEALAAACAAWVAPMMHAISRHRATGARVE
jgi:hypothetical protein